MSETQPFKSHGLFLLWHSLMAVIHISLVSGEGACNMNISAPPIFLIHTAHLHGSLSTVSVWPRPFVYTTETWYFRAVSLKQMGSALAAWCVLPFTDWLKTTSRHILSHSDAKAYLWLTGWRISYQILSQSEITYRRLLVRVLSRLYHGFICSLLLMNQLCHTKENTYSARNGCHIYLHTMHISIARETSFSCHWFTKNNHFLKQENSSLFAFRLSFSINDHKFILEHKQIKQQ